MDCNAWPGTGQYSILKPVDAWADIFWAWTFWCPPQVISHIWSSCKPVSAKVSMNYEKTHNVKLLSPSALDILLLWEGVLGSRYSSLSSAVSLSLPYRMTGPGRDTKRLTLAAVCCLGKMSFPHRRVPQTLAGAIYSCLLPVMWYSKWKIWLKSSPKNTSQQWPPFILLFFFI